MEYVAGRRPAVKTQVRSPGSHLDGVASFEAELCKMNHFIDIIRESFNLFPDVMHIICIHEYIGRAEPVLRFSWLFRSPGCTALSYLDRVLCGSALIVC